MKNGWMMRGAVLAAGLVAGALVGSVGAGRRQARDDPRSRGPG